MTVTGSEHERRIRAMVRQQLAKGNRDYSSILGQCLGADPILVRQYLDDELHGAKAPGQNPLVLRRSVSLPAPDPERSQWWFTTAGLRSIDALVERHVALQETPARILCIGAPSMAAWLLEAHDTTALRDVDPDVVGSIKEVWPNSDAATYDVANDLPTELVGRFSMCIIDPPWYEPEIQTFLKRALEATRPGGEVVCALPPELTRDGISAARRELIARILGEGHDVLGLERAAIGYQVPTFELAALRGSNGFSGIPWRSGDMLHIRRGAVANFPATLSRPVTWKAFWRDRSQFRLFLGALHSADAAVGIVEIDRYAVGVSRKAGAKAPEAWSSEKRGALVGNHAAVLAVVTAWAAGKDREACVSEAAALCTSEAAAKAIVGDLDRLFELWTRFAIARPVRSAAEVLTAQAASNSIFATKATERRHSEREDGFRPQFARDRDRILWSAGLRRLGDKTQLFPAVYGDDLRRRLTHSVEVLQLASTVGESFGLDRDLVEAGALAHDIGHTPFGHAGEFALDMVLNQVNRNLRGFNHYEHGVDVLEFLEGPYYVSETSGFDGLNLSPEVTECVLKHTYCHNGAAISSEEVRTRSKHKEIPAGYCHLEGQAVRAADKISYLVADLEDGIRLGALDRGHLLRCRFFHRPPLEFTDIGSADLRSHFLTQRRVILKLLMEDLIRASGTRLARLGSFSASAVRGADGYTVQHSDEMLADMAEIWEKLQAARLHRDPRVVSANLHAARTVSTLAVACAVLPDLVDPLFRAEYERVRKSKYMASYAAAGAEVQIPADLLTQIPLPLLIGTKVEPGRPARVATPDMVMAKDYVAGLTDSRARGLYEQIVRGDGSGMR